MVVDPNLRIPVLEDLCSRLGFRLSKSESVPVEVYLVVITVGACEPLDKMLVCDRVGGSAADRGILCPCDKRLVAVGVKSRVDDGDRVIEYLLRQRIGSRGQLVEKLNTRFERRGFSAIGAEVHPADRNGILGD